MRKIKIIVISLILCCVSSSLFAKKTTYNDDWTKQTHSNEVAPNYDVVFPQSKVQRIDITLDSADWESVLSDLSENLGNDEQRPMGQGQMRPQPMELGQVESGEMPFRPNQMGQQPMGSNEMGPGGMGPGAMPTSNFDPIWVPCTIAYNGKEWHKVGLRVKGNSTLIRVAQSGNSKYSLKLDFDEYEDLYPELKNQRFYGFKQLNLNNNFEDSSLIREKVSSDLFRKFGITTPQTAFYEVYLNYGEGELYYGIYTMVEEVDDTVIESQFKKSSGNLYKPEEKAGSFASGSFNESEFNLKTKSDKSYSDIMTLYNTLHNPIRTTNSELWKDELESIFDVDLFLKWLAANGAIQNWDSYGNMAHNYYLYNNPSNNLLTWIPWDNNEGLQGGRGRYDINQMEEVDDSWPLISYLFEIEEYRAKYKEYLRQFTTEIFSVDQMRALYDSYYDLLKEYAYAEQEGRSYIGESANFDSAISTLKMHVKLRSLVVNKYLNK